MSQLLSRIMLTIFMLPCAAVLYVVVAVTIESNHVFSYPFRRYATWVIAGVAAWTFIAIYWTLLWRGSVQWTGQRKLQTLLATGGSVVVGLVSGALMTGVDDGFGAWGGSVVAPLVWLIATTLLWRETADERAARATGRSALTCPTCGYNLTGLQSTRCPECGTQFTLEELLARQQSPVETDLR